MAPKKLSEQDKQEILTLYRQPEQTTSTLADQYGVSNSTISRLLKAKLPTEEYSALIQQKRASDKGGSASSSTRTEVKVEKDPVKQAAQDEAKSKPAPVKAKKEPAKKEPAKKEPAKKEPAKKEPAKKAEPSTPAKKSPVKKQAPQPSPATAETASEEPPDSNAQESPKSRRRSRSRKSSKPTQDDGDQLMLLQEDSIDEAAAETAEESTVSPTAAKGKPVPADRPRPILVNRDEDENENEDDLDDDEADMEVDLNEEAGLDDDYGDDDDDYDEDDEDDEDEDWTGNESHPPLQTLEITPLAEADLPHLCYVVVERNSSELVTLPLKTFADLGEIPDEEGNARTLPIFDNHRVARRFSRRNQRVVKVPDSRLLQETSFYLQAKGITRLLVDGQVYALEDEYEEDAFAPQGFEE